MAYWAVVTTGYSDYMLMTAGQYSTLREGMPVLVSMHTDRNEAVCHYQFNDAGQSEREMFVPLQYLTPIKPSTDHRILPYVEIALTGTPQSARIAVNRLRREVAEWRRGGFEPEGEA